MVISLKFGRNVPPALLSGTRAGLEPEPTEGTCTVKWWSGPVSMLEEFAAEWRALANRVQAPPFLRPEWIQVYLSSFEPDARMELITVERECLLIGVLPLIRERAMLAGMPVRRLRAPASVDWSDRFDIVCDPSDEVAVADSIWRDLAARSDWDVLELVDLPEGGPGWRLKQLAEESRNLVECRVNRRSPYIPIPAPVSDREEFTPPTSAHFRANLRRRRRKLADLGPIEMRRTTTYDPDLFESFLDLEDAGWKGARRTSIRSRERVSQYYRSLVAAAGAHGYLSMYSLEAGGETIAMHLGVALFGRYFVPKLAFNESHHEFGPGHLLVSEVLADCARRGYSEFDFLGDVSPWKREWTDHVRVHYRVHVFSRSWTARMAHSSRYRFCPYVNRSILRRSKASSSPEVLELETA